MEKYIEMNERELFELTIRAKSDNRAKLSLAKYYFLRGANLINKQKREECFEKAVALFEEAWLNGDIAEAAYELGYANFFGIGVKKNIEVARALFEAAYSRENVKAGYMLGKYHHRNKDVELASRYYLEAGEKGYIDAMTTLVWVYKYGTMKNLGKNLVQAEEWARRASQTGAEGQLLYGEFLFEEGRLEQAIEWFTKAIDGGDEYAIYRLAMCYEDGSGVPKNINKAIELYEKSSNGRFTEPLIRLCNIHLNRYNSEGLTDCLKRLYILESEMQDYYSVGEIIHIIKKAIAKDARIIDQALVMEILEWAVSLSTATAECLLGDIYYNGTYGNKDIETAVSYYTASLVPYEIDFNDDDYDSGTEDRRDLPERDKKRISIIIQRHSGSDIKTNDTKSSNTKSKSQKTAVPQSSAQATFNEYVKLAKKGEITALYTLADYYYVGVGTERNYAKSAEALLELDKKNTMDLLNDLGLKRAINLYKRLAKMHKKGLGVQKDSIKAREFKERINALKNY